MPSSLPSHVHLPLIDISQFPSDFDYEGINDLQNHPVVAAVREACQEWGFFSVANHGISVHLLQEVDSLIRELCAMSAEAKQRAVTSNPVKSYSGTASAESFYMSKLPGSDSNSVQELSDKIWPEEGNPMFCETIGSYVLCMEDLTRKISKIIIASLGLHVETFYHADFDKCTASLRINHYFSNGKNLEEEIMLSSHTDIGCFTILYQDNKGGLQIRSKEGEWMNVKPQPDSLVVNLGDSLKAWSNRRYRSAEHRVVGKGWANRFSVPYFVRFPEYKQILSPAELVDDEHPRRYRPLIFPQFENDYMNSLEFKEKKHTTFFERYAAI